MSRSKLKIFVSYRRDDSGGHAGRLYADLVKHFGAGQIFMDIGTIKAGEDFYEAIDGSVRSCDVLIAIIGKQWLTIRDGDERRLNNPNDFVRLEIVEALSRDILVIPALVQGATIPHPKDLPDELESLSHRQRCEISDTRWDYDVKQLIKRLEQVLPKRKLSWRTLGLAAGCLVGIFLVVWLLFNILRQLPLSSTNSNVANTQGGEASGNSNNKNMKRFIEGEVPSRPSRTYIRGPKGGCYYLSNSGLKVYVDRNLCK
jgi:hypothetical protein